MLYFISIFYMCNVYNANAYLLQCQRRNLFSWRMDCKVDRNHNQKFFFAKIKQNFLILFTLGAELMNISKKFMT